MKMINIQAFSLKNTLITFLTVLIFLVSFFYSIHQAQARSGCCSHHGGVCGCGCCDGTSLSSTCAPYYPECSGGDSTLGTETRQFVSTPIPIQATTRTTTKPIVKPTSRPTLKPTTSVAKCSAESDGICSKTCTAGNDTDCCGDVQGYAWYENWGCYPEKLSCSAETDGVCNAYCSAGNDADCCTERLDEYQWYDNWGCYPKKI